MKPPNSSRAALGPRGREVGFGALAPLPACQVSLACFQELMKPAGSSLPPAVEFWGPAALYTALLGDMLEDKHEVAQLRAALTAWCGVSETESGDRCGRAGPREELISGGKSLSFTEMS